MNQSNIFLPHKGFQKKKVNKKRKPDWFSYTFENNKKFKKEKLDNFVVEKRNEPKEKTKAQFTSVKVKMVPRIKLTTQQKSLDLFKRIKLSVKKHSKYCYIFTTMLNVFVAEHIQSLDQEFLKTSSHVGYYITFLTGVNKTNTTFNNKEEMKLFKEKYKIIFKCIEGDKRPESNILGYFTKKYHGNLKVHLSPENLLKRHYKILSKNVSGMNYYKIELIKRLLLNNSYQNWFSIPKIILKISDIQTGKKILNELLIKKV